MQKRFAIMTILVVVALFLALGSQVFAATATTVTFPDGLNATITQHDKTELTAVVPNGVVDGNITVNTNTGTSNPAPFMVGDWFTPDPAGAATTATITASGTLTEDTVWDQDILLTGDVVVPDGITLTIEPGVTVLFDALSDDQAGGTWPEISELRVYGTLTAVGTPTDPIHFTSNADSPASLDWGSIIIYKNSLDSHLAYCTVSYARHAIYFLNLRDGDGLATGLVEHCTIQESLYGIYLINRPGTGSSGGTSHSIITVTNNLIQNNDETGINLVASTGSIGSSLDSSLIYNNLVKQNNVGIALFGNHWGNGQIDVQSTIKNNRLQDNNTYNMYLQIKDLDVTVRPIIENNLFINTSVMTNTHLYIGENPSAGNSGPRVYSPTIRYNTFANAAYGIQMETAHDIAMYPVIDHNIFYGLSDFAVSNTTTYTVSVEQNYWGSNETAWDIGATGWVTGLITSTNHLDSSSAPILTYVSPGLAQSGESVKLYGANFGVPTENISPVAENDAYTTAYETALTVNAPGTLTNDTDSNEDSLTAVLDTNVQHGELTLNSNGSFTYTPDTGFSGDDAFTYHANDGQADSNIATVTITVETQVNTSPVAVDDTFTTTYETELVISVPGVLDNDTDDDEDSLTAVVDTTVQHGTLNLIADGSFTYTPDDGFSGDDTFTYHANDGQADSNIATVTITVEEQTEFFIFLPMIVK